MNTVHWTSWHLHLATGAVSALDRVITEVAAPSVQDTGKPWFFIRYWQGGPHVRLRVADLDPTQRARIRHGLEALMARHGVPRDDEALIDEAGYTAEATRQAQGEIGENREVSDLRPAGVYDAVYTPEIERYGGPQVMAASEHLFTRSTALVHALLPSMPTFEQRRSAALRITEAAGRALGAPQDQAVFYEIGRRSWIAWATSYGFDETLVRRFAHPRTSPHSTAFTHRSWVAAWHSDVQDLTRRLSEVPLLVPGAVLSSQVHMTHNRLGLTILDELRTYALLAQTFPAPADSVPDLGLPAVI